MRGTDLSKRHFFPRLYSLFKTPEDTLEALRHDILIEQNWTWKNHLTFGFHKNSSNAVDKDSFFCKMGSISRKVETAFKEAQIAARLILNESKKMGQEVFLCVSGGIDSEAMLRAFMAVEEESKNRNRNKNRNGKSNPPFHAVIMRFNDKLNDFDIENVIQFCEENHVSHEVFDLNVLDFFESGKYLEYGKMYQCQSPQLAAHLHLLDQIKGVPVLSWQPPEIFFHYNQEAKSIPIYNLGLPGHLHGVLLRYFVQRKRFGVPFFFAYTPELIASFFHLPFLQTMLWFGFKGANVDYCYCVKCLSYKDSGFSVKPRKASYTGFEKIRKHYDVLDKKQYGVAFNERYRTPLKKLNPLPKKFYQVVQKNVLFVNSKQIRNLERKYGKQLLHKETDVNSLFKKEMDKFHVNEDEAPPVYLEEFMKENNRISVAVGD